MSLPSKFISSHVLNKGHTSMDLYLDFVCPFSAKAWKVLSTQVFPMITKDEIPISVIFRHVPHPYHPTSPLTHEAAIAVALIDPTKFYDFCTVLFDHQKEFFDEATYHESRHQTYERLADLAHTTVGVDKGKVMEKLTVNMSKPNGGNAVTADLMYFIRFHRQNALRVTPSAAFNGVYELGVSSSWDADQWRNAITAQL
ncbi:hypothetical protein CANCADRAFT_140648 [Tortispora caseinolytica NRRL Y-17796]|uniref:Uncharacterized protein n=1 Tax=Tortispora caseinolytica NRRL Y-17796 TaxID=767744 RepID=A0A1E4TCR1_9ASCO|nr:hypothetical protein CANCADRAFT_140648 [Tortispora caseinolytica NRRL Y-17796]